MSILKWFRNDCCIYGFHGQCTYIVYTMCIYNIRTLSENIKFICTSFRNKWKREPLASFASLFRSVCKAILYLTKMYIYCVYSAT